MYQQKIKSQVYNVKNMHHNQNNKIKNNVVKPSESSTSMGKGMPMSDFSAPNSISTRVWSLALTAFPSVFLRTNVNVEQSRNKLRR